MRNDTAFETTDGRMLLSRSIVVWLPPIVRPIAPDCSPPAEAPLSAQVTRFAGYARGRIRDGVIPLRRAATGLRSSFCVRVTLIPTSSAVRERRASDVSGVSPTAQRLSSGRAL